MSTYRTCPGGPVGVPRLDADDRRDSDLVSEADATQRRAEAKLGLPAGALNRKRRDVVERVPAVDAIRRSDEVRTDIAAAPEAAKAHAEMLERNANLWRK